MALDNSLRWNTGIYFHDNFGHIAEMKFLVLHTSLNPSAFSAVSKTRFLSFSCFPTDLVLCLSADDKLNNGFNFCYVERYIRLGRASRDTSDQPA